MVTTTTGLLHADVTGAVLGAFYDVYDTHGYGFLEVVYRRAMLVALRSRRIEAETEVPFTVHYRGAVVGEYRADLVVERRVIVECKCADHIGPAHEAQILNYLKASGLSVGLLLNFGPRPTFRRLIRSSPSSSSRSSSRSSSV
jgi:GxxExxY protein